MKKLIVFVAQAKIDENSGMGRVTSHWQHEIERRGYEFIHIGEEQTGSVRHPALFPYAAYRAYRRLGQPASLLLVHEPAAGTFTRLSHPLVVFSHGLERRGWQLTLQGQDGSDGKLRRRTRMLFPFWRLRQCDIGMRKAAKLLLINQQDAHFAETYYQRERSHFQVFRNGVSPSRLTALDQPANPTVLFIGAWLERKGIRTLVDAARILHEQQIKPHWILAGTGVSEPEVRAAWPEAIWPDLEIIPGFQRSEEDALFSRASLFVLPSFFEGQPLALLQAMETGRCCITSDCCGQRDLIQHDINGMLHEPGDAKALARLIVKGLSDEKLRIRIGGEAKRSVKMRSWETVASETIDWVEDTMKNSGNNGSGWAH
jgi:glycosyltransferase involved in cell wall biosynthesis